MCSAGWLLCNFQISFFFVHTLELWYPLSNNLTNVYTHPTAITHSAFASYCYHAHIKSWHIHFCYSAVNPVIMRQIWFKKPRLWCTRTWLVWCAYPLGSQWKKSSNVNVVTCVTHIGPFLPTMPLTKPPITSPSVRQQVEKKFDQEKTSSMLRN